MWHMYTTATLIVYIKLQTKEETISKKWNEMVLSEAKVCVNELQRTSKQLFEKLILRKQNLSCVSMLIF